MGNIVELFEEMGMRFPDQGWAQYQIELNQAAFESLVKRERWAWEDGHHWAVRESLSLYEAGVISRQFLKMSDYETVLTRWGIPQGEYRMRLRTRLMVGVERDNYTFEPRNSTERGIALELWLMTV